MARSRWGSISLTSCKLGNATHADTSLYLQPSLGFCTISDTLETKTTQCTLWSNNNFWSAWDAATLSDGAAKTAASKTFPGVYALLCVMAFIGSLNMVVVLLHQVRPQLLSRRLAQMSTVGTQSLLFVLMVAALTGDLTTPLTDPKSWATFYLSQYHISCSKSTYNQLIGTLWASLALILSFTMVLLGVPTQL